MIEPVYDGLELNIPSHSGVLAYEFKCTDCTAILQDFSFFCEDERAKDITVNIQSGQTKISPFRLLKGYRGDKNANIFIPAQDRLRIEVANDSEIELPVTLQVTLRKYRL